MLPKWIFPQNIFLVNECARYFLKQKLHENGQFLAENQRFPKQSVINGYLVAMVTCDLLKIYIFFNKLYVQHFLKHV